MSADRILTALLALILGACRGGPVVFRDPQGEGSLPIRAIYDGAESLAPGILDETIRRHLLALSRDPRAGGEGRAAARALEDRYRRAGFAKVRVRWEGLSPKEENGIRRAFFRIEEGPLLRIEGLEIEGAGDVEIGALLARTPWKDGLRDLPYDPALLETLRTGILEALHGRGFLEASVDPPGIEELPGRRVRIRIRIRKGPLYTLAGTRLRPELKRIFEKEGIEVPEGPAPGGPFDLESLERWFSSLSALLREHGHPRPVIRPRIGRKVESREAMVEVGGDPGPLRFVSEVTVEGAERIFPERILARSSLRPGRLYRGSDEDRTVRALLEEPGIERVEIRDEEIGGRKARFVIRIEETKEPRLLVLPRYYDYEGYGVDLELTERSLLGGARDLRLYGSADRKGQSGGAGITLHRFLGTGTRLLLDGGFSRLERPAWSAKEAHGELRAVRPLHGSWMLDFGYRFTRVFRTGPDLKDPSILRNFDEGSLKVSLALDERDRELLPTRGNEGRLSLALADPALGGAIAWRRLSLSCVMRRPFVGSSRLEFSYAGDLLWTDEGSNRLPVQRRLYLGGHESLRSFRQDRAGPRSPSGDPTGGEYRNLFELGLHAPFAEGAFEFVLSAQAGNLGRAVQDYGLDGMQYALGLGLQGIQPAGLVRIDLSFQPSRRPGEREWLLLFRFGGR